MVKNAKLLPKRIILIRHGESEGNLDKSTYTTTPDHKIQLTDAGRAQARDAGVTLRSLINNNNTNTNSNASSPSSSSSSPSSSESRVYFYVSPYERSRSTLREIGRSFSRRRVLGVREECRIREQDFGNFQVQDRMKVIRETRERFGRFFYRFPEGESAADVFDRISSFLESLWRDIEMNRFHIDPAHDLNLVIVSHGLTSRVFLMKWFKWRVDQFERLNNLSNCELRIMELGQGGDYSLAFHHSEKELREWGLSSEMIEDQKWRMSSTKGQSDDQTPWDFLEFFDHLTDSDSDYVKGTESDGIAKESDDDFQDC